MFSLSLKDNKLDCLKHLTGNQCKVETLPCKKTNKNMKKIEAAKELLVVYNNYECRKIRLATILRKMFKDGDLWRVMGYAHDYTV